MLSDSIAIFSTMTAAMTMAMVMMTMVLMLMMTMLMVTSNMILDYCYPLVLIPIITFSNWNTIKGIVCLHCFYCLFVLLLLSLWDMHTSTATTTATPTTRPWHHVSVPTNPAPIKQRSPKR